MAARCRFSRMAQSRCIGTPMFLQTYVHSITAGDCVCQATLVMCGLSIASAPTAWASAPVRVRDALACSYENSTLREVRYRRGICSAISYRAKRRETRVQLLSWSELRLPAESRSVWCTIEAVACGASSSDVRKSPRSRGRYATHARVDCRGRQHVVEDHRRAGVHACGGGMGRGLDAQCARVER